MGVSSYPIKVAPASCFSSRSSRYLRRRTTPSRQASMRHTKKLFFALNCAFLLAGLSSACNKNGYPCTTEDVPNMIVTVVDEQGNGVADPKLRVEAQLGDDGQWRAC